MSEDIRNMGRFLRSNVWVGITTVIALVALAAAIVATVGLGQVRDRQEQDRIAADVDGCQRGNRNREEQAEQVKSAIVGVVDALLANRPEEQRAAIHDVVVSQLDGSVVARVTDCSAEIIGADPDAPDFPEG